MPGVAVDDPQLASPSDTEVRRRGRRPRKRRRRPRTVIGAWAAASTEAGFWLGTAFASAAIGAPVILGLTHFAVSGGLANLEMPDLSHAGGAAAFYLILAVIALMVGWVVGSISGLALGVLNGLVLLKLSRTAAFRAATPVCQRRLAAVAVIVSTASAWIAAQSAWLGVGLGVDRVVVVYLPAAAGAIVAARLSSRLPPVRA